MTDLPRAFFPTVAVVVPAFNAQATLSACLESLCAQTYPRERTEILVVDNGSSDQTPSVIEAFSPQVRYLLEPARGRSAAQNCGIVQARSEMVALIDADCIAEPSWLEQLVVPLQQEAVGVVGGAIRSMPTDNPIELFGEQIHNQERAICHYQPPYVATANWASPRQLLLGLGGFDPGLPRGQDTDLAWRILQSGKRLVYQPEAVVYHRHARTLREWFRVGYQHGYHSVFLNRKHLKFLQAYGYRSVNRHTYYRLFAGLHTYFKTGSTDAQCDFIFNAGKKLGRWAGSIRSGYLEL